LKESAGGSGRSDGGAVTSARQDQQASPRRKEEVEVSPGKLQKREFLAEPSDTRFRRARGKSSKDSLPRPPSDAASSRWQVRGAKCVSRRLDRRRERRIARPVHSEREAHLPAAIQH
jgi:hypothetical protein